jgi:hypothetical protein
MGINMSSDEVALFWFCQYLGSGERKSQFLFYFGSANILEVKANSFDFLFKCMQKMR